MTGELRYALLLAGLSFLTGTQAVDAQPRPAWIDPPAETDIPTGNVAPAQPEVAPQSAAAPESGNESGAAETAAPADPVPATATAPATIETGTAETNDVGARPAPIEAAKQPSLEEETGKQPGVQDEANARPTPIEAAKQPSLEEETVKQPQIQDEAKRPSLQQQRPVKRVKTGSDKGRTQVVRRGMGRTRPEAGFFARAFGPPRRDANVITTNQVR
jgi:hypothetical protein